MADQLLKQATVKQLSLFCLLSLGLSLTETTVAQTLSTCQPPRPNEYLLLVVSETKETQEQIRRTLPSNAQSTLCKYLNDTVTRIGGFQRIEDADSWARYVNEIVGLQAFVARPAEPPRSQTPTPAQNLPAYNPKPLGDGYAVLVDYFNKPEVATQLRQLLESDIGLVSYGQRPYLLIIHTDSQRRANSTLQQLSDRGFWAMVVDSSRVTLLKSAVSGQ